jgi:hypothetical protein
VWKIRELFPNPGGVEYIGFCSGDATKTYGASGQLTL